MIMKHKMTEQSNNPANVENENPFERKSCYDCLHLEGYVSLWCASEEAREYRGTGIPGVIHCKFWEPHYGRR